MKKGGKGEWPLRLDMKVYNETNDIQSIGNYEKKSDGNISLPKGTRVAVEKMVISSAFLPISFFQVDGSGDSKYEIQFEVGGAGYITKKLRAVPSMMKVNDNTYLIIDFNSFWESVNAALADGGSASFFRFDPNSKLTSFFVLAGTTDSFTFGSNLLRFMQGFALNLNGTGAGIELQYVDPGGWGSAANNSTMGGAGFDEYKQCTSLLSNWFDVVGMRLTTNMFAMKPEINSGDVIQTIEDNQFERQVLAPIAFEFSYQFPEGSSNGARGQTYYTPDIPKEVYVTNCEIKAIQLSFSFILRDGSTQAGILGPNDYAHVKFVFTAPDE
jgi:hypothetical protein